MNKERQYKKYTMDAKFSHSPPQSVSSASSAALHLCPQLKQGLCMPQCNRCLTRKYQTLQLCKSAGARKARSSCNSSFLASFLCSAAFDDIVLDGTGPLGAVDFDDIA